MNKKTINTATANTEDPTPGYLFKEIIEMTFLEIATVQVLVDFLVSKVTEAIEYEYSHTLIKTLKIIRQMCEFGHVGFQNAMQQHVNELKEATAYRGGYSSTDGNAVRQNVKAAARQAIDALFVVRKEKPIAHATAMASSGSSSAAASKEALPAMYRKQHRKPLYVAPNVPLAPKPVFAPPPVQSVPEPVEARPQPQAEEPLNVKLVVYELIALPRDLESSDLHRFYDKCTALTDSHRDISFWEEVGSVLDHSFTNVRRLETVFNAVRLTEYLLKRDVAGVKEYFDVHRTNLKKLRRDIRVTLRPKIDRVFAILPEREEAEAAEASPIDIQAALPVEGGERQPVYDSTIEPGNTNLTENDVPGRREFHRTRQYRPRLPLVPPARRPSTAMPEKPQVKQPIAPSIDDLFSSVHIPSTNSEDAETQEANAEEIQSEATKPTDFADLHDLILG